MGRVRRQRAAVDVMKAECHSVHKTTASEVKASLSQAAVSTCPLSL